MERPSVIRDDARDDIAVAVLMQMIVEIGLRIADVAVELGIVSVVILGRCHLLRSVGVGDLPVH